MAWVLIVILSLHLTGTDGCELPSSLNGTWTSTNFGTVVIQTSSPQVSMTQTFTGITGSTTDFNCLLIDGDNYVLQSNESVTVFSGTTNIYIYMCISFTVTSDNSFIYYLNSNTEAGLNNYRMVGLPISTAVTTSSQVCTATLDTAEYNTMVRDGVTGLELGTVQCPTPLLGLFLFTYVTGGTTFCDTVNATLNTCNNQSLTGILTNDSACDTANPFYSTGGVLGCLTNLYNTDTTTYYTTLYNGDASVDDTATYRFSCLAISTDTNGTVYVSVSPTACVSAQTSTTAPSPGALMVLNPDFTCNVSDDHSLLCGGGVTGILFIYVVSSDMGVPEFTDESKDYTVLIVLLCVFVFVIIVVIIIVILCYFRYRKLRKERAREKKMLVSEDHPMGEVSIALDTPATMEPRFEESNRHDVFRSPRRKKGFGTNPLGESSMNLDFLDRKWTPRPPSRLNLDPFTEMESGTIVPLSPQGSKTIRSLKSRQGSFVGKSMLNGDVNRKSIKDSKPEELNVKALMNGSTTSKRGTKSDFVRGTTMIKAPSIRSARSIKAPSVVTESLRSNGAVVRVDSIKSKSKQTSKPARPQRSATSTRIGSVTKGSMAKRNSMARSKTVLVPTKTVDGPEMGDSMDTVHDFMAGEMQSGEALSTARSQTGKSRKSTKSTKSKSMTARSSGGPSRSFIRKSSSKPKRTLVEMADQVMAEPKPEPEPYRDSSFMSRDLNRESFRTAMDQREMRLRAKKPLASKGPWK